MYGFFYASFRGLGSLLLRIFPGIGSKLDAAVIRVHPEAYASAVAGLTVIAALACAPLSFILYLVTRSPFSLALMVVPLMVLLLGVFYPYAQASIMAFPYSV